MRHSGLRSLLLFTGGAALALALLHLGSARSVDAARYEDLDLFASVLHLVRRNYVEDVDETELIRDAVRGLLAELDPHSSYMDPETHREMQIDTRGEFHGIGIEISKRRDGFIEVVAPIDGTPAANAGIQARDQIVAICPPDPPADWESACGSTKEMSLFDAVRLMRGPRGSEITIQVLRDGLENPQSYTIVRDVVKVASVEGRALDDGYGYIRIRSFQERTGADLGRTLGEVREQTGGELQGLVLDLRDNPGGLLDQAVDVADHWLPGGLVVYTQGRVETQRQEFNAEPHGTEPVYPLVVLVNAGSASASEIVAGALQDHGRALVLGTATFGKGSVQTVYPLEDGSGLRLTTSLYYTPSGRSIQEVGIQPDIEVAPATQVAGAETPGEVVRERDLRGHFHNPADPGEPEQSAAAGEVESSDTEDLQLARAVEVLKSWAYFQRLELPQSTAAQAAGAPTP